MVTFTFGPFVLQLINPDFGDRESLEIRRVSRKTRGGDLVVFRDPGWPKFATYQWKWSFLNQGDLSRLLYFVRQSLGQVITVVDYEGRTLTGCIITTPANEVSQEGREDYRAGLSFQVTL
jgi:hypothetical protein